MISDSFDFWENGGFPNKKIQFLCENLQFKVS